LTLEGQATVIAGGLEVHPGVPACPDIQDQVQAKVEQMAAGSS
jgi:hypothetical protein